MNYKSCEEQNVVMTSDGERPKNSQPRCMSSTSISSMLSFDSMNMSEDDSFSSDKDADSTFLNCGNGALSDCCGVGARRSANDSVRSHYYNRAEPWMQRAWIIHFLLGFSMLLYSVWANGGSKYIPVDPYRSSKVSGFEDLRHCQKVFLDVMASSRDDPRAVVCCSLDNSNISNHGQEDMTSSSFEALLLGLCPPPANRKTRRFSFPFMGRLAKFPDAWLIPLFPLLLRIAFRTYQTVLENATLVMGNTFGVYSFRRLVFYFMLMQFRGWILYVVFNGIEDFLSKAGVGGDLDDDYNSDHNYSLEYSGGSSGMHMTSISPGCWYREFLQDSQHGCQGRKFDFSDHIVLYYAQLLPIALVEYLHSIDRPYWPFHCFRRVALPILLSSGMLYLYFINFVGVYKTAAYFHTPAESLAGYAVSLLAQVPLCVLQCSNGIGFVHDLREYFFGPEPKILLQ